MTDGSSGLHDRAHAARFERASPTTHAHRVLAEAVGIWESANGPAADDDDAIDAAVAGGGDLESRVIHRAHSLQMTSSVQHAIKHIEMAMAFIIVLGVVLALAGGVTAAGTALDHGPERPVNIFRTMIALLGVQTLALAVWLAVMVWSPAAAGRLSIGGWLLRLAERCALRLHRGPADAAAVSAIVSANFSGSRGKWAVSSLSHLLWLAFNAGCIATLAGLLSTRQYQFAWETTILSESTFVRFTRMLAAAPEAAGFPAPTEAQIRASRWSAEVRRVADLGGGREWAGLLIGCVVVYGFGPRVLLLGVCMGQRRTARSRWRLDLASPRHARVVAALQATTSRIGVIDPDAPSAASGSTPAPSQSEHSRTASAESAGPIVLIAYELPDDDGAAPWPPAVGTAAITDLGRADSRSQQQQILERLRRLNAPPPRLVVAASLTTSPDRGVAGFLDSLRTACSAPLALLLTGGQSLRDRMSPAEVHRRIDDWHALATRAGVPAHDLLELDLDHLTASSQSRLTAFLGGADLKSTATLAASRIDAAFELAAAFARDVLDGRETCDARSQMKLHQRLTTLFHDEGSHLAAWLRPLDAAKLRAVRADPKQTARELTHAMESQAQRWLGLLPPGLRASPKWAVAGAVSGALGCLAATMLIAPVAISALPVWTIVGGGLSAVVGSALGGASSAGAPSDDRLLADLGQALASAAYTSLLLDLQGCDEREITHILHTSLEGSTLATSIIRAEREAVAALDGVRLRYLAARANHLKGGA